MCSGGWLHFSVLAFEMVTKHRWQKIKLKSIYILCDDFHQLSGNDGRMCSVKEDGGGPGFDRNRTLPGMSFVLSWFDTA